MNNQMEFQSMRIQNTYDMIRELEHKVNTMIAVNGVLCLFIVVLGIILIAE